jgi:hypothetical protein
MLNPIRRGIMLRNLDLFYHNEIFRSRADVRGIAYPVPVHRTERPGFKPSVESDSDAEYRQFRAMIERQQSITERERLEQQVERMRQRNEIRRDTLYPNSDPAAYASWPVPQPVRNPGYSTLQSVFSRAARSDVEPHTIRAIASMNPVASGVAQRSAGYQRVNLGPVNHAGKWFRSAPVPLNNVPVLASKPTRTRRTVRPRTVREIVLARRSAVASR